jgi:putative membrane protein
MKTKSLLLGLSLPFFALASTGFAAVLNGTDQSFLKDAYQDGVGEVKMGQMGQAKTGNADVKSFATMIVADHTKANAEMKSLADSKQLKVPEDPSLTSQAKAKMLDAKTGANFEKEYIDGMIKDHKNDIEKFQKESLEAKDPDVKAFAQKTLPTLREHLKMAEDIQAKIGK